MKIDQIVGLSRLPQKAEQHLRVVAVFAPLEQQHFLRGPFGGKACKRLTGGRLEVNNVQNEGILQKRCSPNKRHQRLFDHEAQITIKIFESIVSHWFRNESIDE